MGMTRYPVSILIVLGLACSCAPSQRSLAGSGSDGSVLSLAAPERVGSYHLVERRDSGNPRDGVAHRYSSPPGEQWTAYFYRPDPEGSGESSEELLDAQLAIFKQVLEYRHAQGAYDAYKIAVEAPDPIRVDGNTLPGRKLAYAFRKGDATYISALFLYAVREGCVKIRGTVDRSTWERAQPTFPRDFIRALLSQNYPL